MNLRRYALVFVASLTGALSVLPVYAQVADNICGNPFVNSHGPFDYRIERGAKLKIVEDYHFNPRVEALISGQSATIEGDLAYTLRAFPNHHRALISMLNLSTRPKLARPVDAPPMECYFFRASRFAPDDPIVRMIYAKFLAARNRKPEALQQLTAGIEAAKDNPFTHYNLGLVYFEMGEPELALKQAHRAMALGLQRPELKQRLEALGKWVEPSAAAAPSGAASAAASAPPG